MSLLMRINLALLATLGITGLALSYVASLLLQANAKHEVTREASLMLDSALAMRTYTAQEILPLLSDRLRTQFLPQSVPFYAAAQNFLKLREQHPEYAYKEATLNPTNPRDRATDWESDLIQQFRNDPATHELVGQRDTPLGRSLYLARAIRVEDRCLACHSTPASAPVTLTARYGSDNGFGWQAHDVVGASVVSVPLTAALAGADNTFRNIVIAISVAMAALLLMVNAVLYFFVLRPLRRISGVAAEWSVGNRSASAFPTGGGSELTALMRSFDRMRVSLDKAMKLLEH
jgi:protein-histidine pros-kinase